MAGIKLGDLAKSIKITNKDIYYSPTDMGVNMLAQAITDESIICEAAKKEIIRRYYQERCNYKLGLSNVDTIQKIKLLMNELYIDTDLLDTVEPALKKANKVHRHVVSLKLPNGKIVTGKETELLSPASSVILNAIKEITKIPDEIDLLSESVLKPILKLRENSLSDYNKTLQLQEVLIALSICAVTNPIIQKALNNIQKLKNCDAHATYIISNGDLKTLKSLKINLTCEPVFLNDSIY